LPIECPPKAEYLQVNLHLHPEVDLLLHYFNVNVNVTFESSYFITLIGFNTLRTGDADFRLYITTVQDG